MSELPTGTVTFLFTDIEGSTRLLHELGDAYADALAEPARAGGLRRPWRVEVVPRAMLSHRVRPGARRGRAAADAQQALCSGPIRVRMGIHTGEPLRTDKATSEWTSTRAPDRRRSAWCPGARLSPRERSVTTWPEEFSYAISASTV
jgi:hypothetical protein